MITVVPFATLVTTPDDEPIVATDVVPLLHVPPGVALLKVSVPPLHNVNVPVIGVLAFTVMVNVAAQPPDAVYVITELPGNTPVTIPVPLVIVATVVVLLLHEPPAVASLNVVVLPWHTVGDPMIGVTLPTVTRIVAIQPPPGGV